MKYSVTEESLADLHAHFKNARQNLDWTSVFLYPGWLQAWWQIFGDGAELFLRAVRQESKIIGITPLLLRGKTASFVGSVDVCDYLDFIVSPGREGDFFNSLLDYVKDNGINQVDLRLVRPDSLVLIYLMEIARKRDYEVLITNEDVSLELDLPSTWDEYLSLLATKQRHEVRRKLRRLMEEGNVYYHFIEDGAALSNAMDTFLKMFTESRQDKAKFMTEKMGKFFRLLAQTMEEAGFLRLGLLELDKKPMAMVMCFDYKDTIYLYNSGYDPAYESLSTGLLSKVLAIKDSIQKGKKRFDFLKGSETYKYHLGGREVPLSSCQITIK